MVVKAVFTSRMNSLRVKRGISQAELGRVLGLSRSTISMYERGNREPSFEVVEQIANALNTVPAYLLGWTDDPDTLYEGSYKTLHDGKIVPADGTIHPLSSADKVIVNPDKDDKNGSYAARERLRRSPGMRTLFDAVEDATEEELASYARMIKAFRGDDE